MIFFEDLINNFSQVQYNFDHMNFDDRKNFFLIFIHTSNIDMRKLFHHK